MAAFTTQKFWISLRKLCTSTFWKACLQTSYPTVASLHHSFINGYKRVLAVAVETNSSFPLDEKVKAFLVDLSAFAAAAPAVTEAAAPAAAVPAKEEVKEKSKEFDEDMGFGLFD